MSSASSQRPADALHVKVPAFLPTPSVAEDGRGAGQFHDKVDKSSRTLCASQGTVSVAVRLKPPLGEESVLQYGIETDMSTKMHQTGPQQESAPCGKTNRFTKGTELTRSNGTGACCDDKSDIPNLDISSSATVPHGAPVTDSCGGTQLFHFVPVAGAEEGNILTITTPTESGAKGKRLTYEFGRVFGPTMSDDEICGSIVPGVVEQVTNGVSSCVLCYGQSGSGKTHTISALTSAFINKLFTRIDMKSDMVEISFIQIYNNTTYNLLGGEKSSHGIALQKPVDAVACEPRYLVQNAADAIARVVDAQRKRFVGQNVLNACSSRSHVLLSLHLTKCADGIPVPSGRITLVDMAGSEGVKQADVVGNELDEAVTIGKSLSLLDSVINAVQEGTNMPPACEFALMPYLASTLDDCCLLVIATISLDKQSVTETKSSLDFATRIGRCSITRREGRVMELLMSNDYNFEETCEGLTREVETLRDHVATLQEEILIEKQLSLLSQREGMTHSAGVDTTSDSAEAARTCQADREATLDTNDPAAERVASGCCEDGVIRERLMALERRCAAFQSALVQRERELCSLGIHKPVAGKLRQKLEQRVREYNEMQQNLEEAVLGSETDDLLRRVADASRWMAERLDRITERKRIVTKALEVARCEQKCTVEEFLTAARRVVQSEKTCEELRRQLEEVRGENTTLKGQLEELNLKLLHEYTDRVIREETVAWFKASGERAEECRRLTTAFEDQRNLCDVLQGRLTSTEEELERGNKEHCVLLQEMQRKDEAFRSIWVLLTPQQKARFMSVGYAGDVVENPGSASLHQGHENVQLRSQVRALRKQLEDEVLCSRERDYRIEDLECENRLLQERLQHRENEYKNLVALDQDYMDERDQMEGQIAHLCTYIEEHNERQRLYERQLREVQLEWEKLNEEHHNSKLEVAELTAKLAKAKEEIIQQESSKHVLKNRHIHESHEHDITLATLRHQLALKQRTNDEVSRRLGLAERRRQHVRATVIAHKRHSDLVRRKAMKRNPEILGTEVGQQLGTAPGMRASALQTSLKVGHSQRPRCDPPKQPLRSVSSASNDATMRLCRDPSTGGSNHNTYLRRRTFSLNRSRDGRPQSAMRRATSASREKYSIFF
uniref:Putative kinesin n=1 Tax=Trypanosoma congolense (strain IL3000) TaxID=1068625 RepID=G0UY23_TRYCI|nr:putative kinesin [Trypanosoma congolense IL3000]